MKKIMQGLSRPVAALMVLSSMLGAASSIALEDVAGDASIVGGQTVADSADLNVAAETRIVGGSVVSAARSWMVSIQGSTGHFCGGSLIHPDWVLTAAHCVEDITDPSSLFLFIGGLTSKTANQDVELRRGELVFVHPFYDGDVVLHDIALIKLNESSTKTPLKIADSQLNSQLTVGLRLKVMGWGLTEDGGTTTPNNLLEVNLPLQDDRSCRSIHGGTQSYWDHFLCVGEVAGGVDACQGDSGGPLVTDLGSEWAQVGIVSWGAGCALPNAFGAYSEVGAYTDWIEQVTQGVTLFGEPKIGFMGQNLLAGDHPKSGRFNVANFSNDAVTINSQRIQVSASNTTLSEDFQLNSNAPISGQTISARERCDFAVDALGTNVGEHDAVIHLTTTAGQILQQSVNAKVLPKVDAVSDALDNQWVWFNGHDQAWQVATPDSSLESEPTDNYLRSGAIVDDQRSVLLTYLNFPESGGYLHFKHRISTESGEDFFFVTVDEKLEYSTSGELTWQNKFLGPFSGPQHVLFIYVKDESVSVGSDAVYLNDVRICESSVGTNCTTALSDFVTSVEPDTTAVSCTQLSGQSGGPEYAQGTPQSFPNNDGSVDQEGASRFISRSKDKGAAFFWLLLALPILVGAKKPRLNR